MGPETELKTDGRESFGRAFVGICAGGTLLASFLLFLFSRPFADDFCVARDLSHLGLFEGLRFVLTENSSRWAGHTVVYLLHGAFDLVAEYAVPLFLVRSIFLLSLYVLLRSCLGDVKRRGAAFLTVLVATVYFVGMKDPAQTWYWLPGAVVYDLAMAALFVALGLLVRGLRSRHAPTVWSSAGLFFLASGFHELVALLAVGLLGLVFWAASPEGRTRIGLVLSAAVAGLGTLFLVPGGWIRMDVAEPRGVLESLHLGMTQAGGNLLEWVFQPALLLLWSALLLGAVRLELRDGPRPGARRSTALAVAAWLGGSLGPFVVAALAGGKGAPYRTVNLAYLWFLLGSLYLAALVARRWRTRSPAVPSLILLVLLGSSFPLTDHGRSLWKDLLFKAPDFSRRSQAYFAELAAAFGSGDHVEIELDDGSLPRLLYTSALATEDPLHWRNRCIADYFEIGGLELRLDHSEERAGP